MNSKKILGGLIGALALFFAYLAQSAYEFSNDYPAPQNGTSIIISEERVQHILYGDDTGGGHKHGVGRPCKSEFPADWHDGKIIAVTHAIAANDNLDWQQEDNGYFVAESDYKDVRVRVVLGEQKRRVITSYPVNLARNPCPY